jgi:hypothetical protein
MRICGYTPTATRTTVWARMVPSPLLANYSDGVLGDCSQLLSSRNIGGWPTFYVPEAVTKLKSQPRRWDKLAPLAKRRHSLAPHGSAGNAKLEQTESALAGGTSFVTASSLLRWERRGRDHSFFMRVGIAELFRKFVGRHIRSDRLSARRSGSLYYPGRPST